MVYNGCANALMVKISQCFFGSMLLFSIWATVFSQLDALCPEPWIRIFFI